MRYNKLSLMLIFLGLIFLLNNKTDITGYAIGVIDINSSISSFLGLIFLIAGLVLFMVSKDDDSELEKKARKFAIKESKSGDVRFVDPEYTISNELGHPIGLENAEKVLEELKVEFGNEEYRKMIQEDFARTGYFERAYLQRDMYKILNPNSEGYYVDKFLRDWDPNYRPFVPQKNPYLTYDEIKEMPKEVQKHIYDTRKILPLIEKNIKGFHISGMKIGSHDVHVEYRGAKFQVMAGSIQPYEVSMKNIIRVLKRIVKEDLKKKQIRKEDQTQRLEVLKNLIFI